MKKLISAVICVLIIMSLFASCSGGGFSDVYVSEIMASNKRTYADENGEFCDWIEIHNPTSAAIDLKGYMLSDDPYDIELFKFPSVTIGAGEYMVVFADKSKKVDAENGIIHVPFSISSKTEAVSIYTPTGKLINTIRTNRLADDTSIGVGKDGKLEIFENPTPGKANDGSSQVSDAISAEDAKGLYINEYSTDSTQTVMDEDGEFVSFVELFNSTGKSINLKGCSLSDDSKDKAKWIFPNVTIKKGEYLVVYLSGKTKPYENGSKLHADFKLSGNEDVLYLYDKSGKTIDSCKIEKLISNLTCGRDINNINNFVFFAKATPGKPNNLTPFESIDSARLTSNKAVSVTEVAAVNTTVSQSSIGEYFDYIELHNNTKKDINLSDYKLSDSRNSESFKQLPNRTLKAGDYIAIYCADSDYVSSATGNIYVSLGLNRYGEKVYLVEKSSGVAVDTFEYGRLSSGYSAGRNVSGTDETVYYSTLTPGKPNGEKQLGAALANPEFSLSSTYVEKGDTIELKCSDGEIHYTTDGSVPKKDSPIYTDPITINKTTAIRAKVFKSGFVPSDAVSATYIVGRKHTLPVVFLTTDNDNLYGYTNGIWADGPGKGTVFPFVGANYWKDWERPVNFEYMTADGVAQTQFDAGIKVFGQYSRAQEQKSVSINLRDKYGPKEVCYPFFKDNNTNVFSAFVLRDSGQDFTKSHIRDAFCAMVMKNKIDVDIMDYQPVVTYVNGKYHGIYDLREKLDEDYLANHHGIDPDNIDLIKGNNIVQNGTIDDYAALLEYIKTHDMKDEKCYNYVCSKIDIDELISYWMCESFFTNTDTGNIRFWREKTDEGKWRWLFFDMDWALYPSTYTWNYIDNYLNPEGHGVGRSFRTTIMVGLMKNPKFRTRVLEIHSKHINTTFNTERMLKIYDEMIEEIKGEMKYHCDRFDTVSYQRWENSVKELRKIISENHDLFIGKMKESFHMTSAEVEKYITNAGA